MGNGGRRSKCRANAGQGVFLSAQMITSMGRGCGPVERHERLQRGLSFPILQGGGHRHIGTDCCGDGVLRPVYDKAVYHALWHSFRDGSGRSSARILGGDKACSHCKVCSLLWWFQRKQPDAVSGFATHVRNEYESTPWALCRCYPGRRSPRGSGLLTASQCRIARFHKTSYHAAHRHGR